MKISTPTLLLLAATCSIGVKAEGLKKAGNYFNNAQETIVVAAAKGQRNKQPKHGRVKSKTTQVQRTDNGHKRSTEITDRQGRQYNRDATVTRDPEAGVKTRDVEWTGPNGKTAARQDVITRTEDGHTRSSEFTGPNGRNATRDATVTRDVESGTKTRDVTWTGPEGQTATRLDTTTRTESGYTRSTTRTGPAGHTAERDVVSTWDPETRTWTKEVSYDRHGPDVEQ